MTTWNWLRLSTALGAGAAFVGAVLLPPAAVYLIPLGTGLAGVAIRTPGFEPREEERRQSGTKKDSEP